MNLSDKDFDAFLQSHAMNMDSLKKQLENEVAMNKLVEKGTTQSGVSPQEWFRQVSARASIKTFPK